MRKPKYDEATRSAILAAAVASRKADKPWSDTLAAAKEAGYKGTLGGIKQFLIAKKVTTPKVKGKVGRKRGRKPGRPAGSVSKAKGDDIESLVNKLVSSRVNDAIKSAIAALQGSKA